MERIDNESQSPESVVGEGFVKVASRVMSSPEHPQYSADKAMAKVFSGGRGGIIAAIDGLGAGGETSVRAAEIVLGNINSLETGLGMSLPTPNQAVDLLRSSIFQAAGRIKELQTASGNINADTTVCVGMTCESTDRSRRFLVIANAGNSRIYKYRVSRGDVDQLTTDHSLAQALLGAGIITSEVLLTSDPRRDILYKTVGSLKKKDDLDIQITEIENGDMFFAVSDGISQSLSPDGLKVAAYNEFCTAFDPARGEPDLSKFAGGLAKRARNVQMASRGRIKPDDICIAVLRFPRMKEVRESDLTQQVIDATRFVSLYSFQEYMFEAVRGQKGLEPNTGRYLTFDEHIREDIADIKQIIGKQSRTTRERGWGKDKFGRLYLASFSVEDHYVVWGGGRIAYDWSLRYNNVEFQIRLSIGAKYIAEKFVRSIRDNPNKILRDFMSKVFVDNAGKTLLPTNREMVPSPQHHHKDPFLNPITEVITN